MDSKIKAETAPEITPLNVSQLWSLLAAGGAQWLPLQKPAIAPNPDRARLSKLGLIEVVQEQPPPEDRARIRAAAAAREAEAARKSGGDSGSAGGSAKADEAAPAPKAGARAANRRITRFVLTAGGRDWLADHLDRPISARAAVPPALVNFLLAGLARLGPGRRVMAALTGAAEPVPEPAAEARPASGPERAPAPRPSEASAPGPGPAGLEPSELLRRIRRLDRRYFMDSDGLRFSALRRALPEYGRGEIDRALLALQRSGDLVLYPFDNPALITDDDREAVLMVSGSPRHYLFLR